MEWGTGERNGGNDENAGIQGGNVRNQGGNDGNTGNQGGNDENQGRNAGNSGWEWREYGWESPYRSGIDEL